MALQGKPDDLVMLEEIAESSAYEIAAIVAGLEQKGILTQAEVLDQVKQLRDKSGKVR